jgi:exodeoxyribonuclease VII large subunit
MAEIISDKKVFSLLEVMLSIQKTLSERYKSSFWIKAEMNKLNHYSHSGHCYPELVEKKDGKVIAQIKANLWKSDYLRINERFLNILKEPIKDGVKILFCATINFDASHGLGLRIIDIDPSFTLGELEREKQETIEKLNREGIFNNNRRLPLALLPQRIAVISVETSKGYADYLNVIAQNPWHYKYFNFLFPSLLQGEKSVASIINQLKRIRKVVHHFDAVAIIRGGGGDVGLSSFNNYQLAKEIALFPIPVISGIGHSTNETVAEMVSYKNAITPTELADFLIQRFHNFSVPLRKAEEVLIDKSKRILKEERLKFHNTMKYFQSVTRNQLITSRNDLQVFSRMLIQESKFLLKHEAQSFKGVIDTLKKYPATLFLDKNQNVDEVKEELKKQVFTFLQTQKSSVNNLDKHVRILDPVNILKRGFSITLWNGKAVKSYEVLKTDDTITTILADGHIVSNVKNTSK